MKTTTAVSRQTKYSHAIKVALGQLGHATNTQILANLRTSYPELSATTVHRATARLADRGVIALAPKTHDGATRYDANTLPHDHFVCNGCDRLRDTDIKDAIIGLLESGIKDCHISGRLTISGICTTCKEAQ